MYTGCSRLARKLTLATVTASARLFCSLFTKSTLIPYSPVLTARLVLHTVLRAEDARHSGKARPQTDPAYRCQPARKVPIAKTDTDTPGSESPLPCGIEFHCDRSGTTSCLWFSLGLAVAESRTKCYEGPGTRRPSQNRGTAPSLEAAQLYVELEPLVEGRMSLSSGCSLATISSTRDPSNASNLRSSLRPEGPSTCAELAQAFPMGGGGGGGRTDSREFSVGWSDA